jgi:hypothetical protein
MSQHDSVLRMYADSGLRTIEDWTMLARELKAGAKPRLDTVQRGVSIALYTRDQTQPRPRTERDGAIAKEVTADLPADSHAD